MTTHEDWRIYRGDNTPHDGIAALPPPPPWRRFGGSERAETYQAEPRVVDRVNAAILLRRPLLVTGKAGTGKSTLAHSVAHELRLGPVLTWSITSKSTLDKALYDYDAIGRVHESSMRLPTTDIGRYLRLGPLGTALLPGERPRVLLIDELDKSDIDLPNDLLNVFEEGSYRIPELERLPAEQEVVEVMVDGSGERFPITRGRVRCAAFPVVVITSNGEREFPPAFLRRCVRLSIEPPSRAQLSRIVEAHLGAAGVTAGHAVIERFLAARNKGELATDQLLNALHLALSGARPEEESLDGLIEALLRPLDIAGSE
ncbi:MoxR family ATPase [Actinocorallia sp. API 0066]|uniref:AAA family ATPase n=1 Tax=Actinocorallia sp. API 0066 TaxID=2896846 RepID=UPI001E2E8ABF|nr:MoxR family ATPase [Actinocorallia sp. API 0066]MCD0452392.1 MoxR family ATPase [Actinocorallia sp. API 0066]